MDHRHLTPDVDPASVAAVESVFERGSYQDVLELLTRVYTDPWSAEAEAVLEASQVSEVYGYPRLAQLLIEGARSDQKRTAPRATTTRYERTARRPRSYSGRRTSLK